MADEVTTYPWWPLYFWVKNKHWFTIWLPQAANLFVMGHTTGMVNFSAISSHISLPVLCGYSEVNSNQIHTVNIHARILGSASELTYWAKHVLKNAKPTF